MKKDFVYQLDGVRAGVILYAPIFMYIFLKMKKDFQKDGLDEAFNKIYGKPCNKWPDEYKKEFESLFTLEKKWIDLQREFIYFLIFIFSGLTFKYIEKDNQEKMKFVLDYLFEIFKDTKQPWFALPPSEDAFNKYHNADNPFLVFHSSISEASNEEDSLFIFEFITRVETVIDFFIKPAIEKLFK